MRTKLITTILLLACLAGATARAELSVSEQGLSFSEQVLDGHRYCWATVTQLEIPVGTTKSIDIEFAASCPEALGELTFGTVSMWSSLPGDWSSALDPERTATGLFFPAESEHEGTFHAEIGGLPGDWTASAGDAILVVAFDCREVDCDYESLMGNAILRVITEVPGSP